MKFLSNPAFPFHPNKSPIFYGWVIVFWGTIGVLMSMPGQTIGVSVFTDSLIDALQITRNELSLAYMFGTIGSSFMLTWAGRQYDRHGARTVAFAASVGLGSILLILSQIDWIVHSLLQFESSITIIGLMILVFLLLRFFGQGVLTMVARNMIVKWFDTKRGLATGISNVFASLGFSYAPVLLYQLIGDHTWKGAWILLGISALVVFPVLVIFFFRDSPEESGLLPDGSPSSISKSKKIRFPIKKDFNLGEARKSYTFWVFALLLAMEGLYITAFTFHVISIFETAGLLEQQAITIFQPIAIIAIIITLLSSTLSDYIAIKPLFILKGVSACMAIVGLLFLGTSEWAMILLIGGTGLMSGLFSMLMSITWPRYFGKLYLGAISGQVISLIVFGSALGPILFSQSLTHFGSYFTGAVVCLVVYGALTFGVLWTVNTQR